MRVGYEKSYRHRVNDFTSDSGFHSYILRRANKLIIRNAQAEEMGKSYQERFVERMLRHLRAMFAEKLADRFLRCEKPVSIWISFSRSYRANILMVSRKENNTHGRISKAFFKTNSCITDFKKANSRFSIIHLKTSCNYFADCVEISCCKSKNTRTRAAYANP